MKTYLNKIKIYFLAHKLISLVILLVVIFVGQWGYKKITSTAEDTRYITTKVKKGTIVSTVSGTGEVSADSQIDLKPKVSGDIVYIGAENGQKVSAGTIIAGLDAKDAQKSVRDAETSLESAKLSLEKVKIQNSAENMNADSSKAYANGFNAVSDAFLDLTSTTNGLEDMLEQDNLSDNTAASVGKIAQDHRNEAEKSYFVAKKSFEQNKKNYILLNSDSPKQDIENMIDETIETTRLLSDAVKDMLSFVNFMANDSNNPSGFVSFQNTLSSYTGNISSHLSSLTESKTNISENKDSSQSASLDLRSAELSVTERENSLRDAIDKLADYSVRAPFAGTVANMEIKKSDSVGSSTIIATLITDEQVAEISMNEVDVAKIKVGQKATLSFDAIADLNMSGTVAEIDSIGTASQGVVTYNIKISFDSQDERIKPSMSVSADIATDSKTDILIVPNSAVKSQNGKSYVEVFNPPLSSARGSTGSVSKTAPVKVAVQTGISNDSETEILSGLSEGDQVVTRTILPSSATTATSSAPSIFGGGIRAGTGGGNTRAGTGAR